MGFRHIVTKLGLGLKKYSPEILAGVGTVAVIGGVVWACKSAVDAAEDIKKCKDDVAEIKQSVEDGVIEQKAGKKAIRKARFECARVSAIKFAGPAVLIGGGLACHIKAKSIVGRRLDGVAAAYAALNSRYDILAENVKKEYGEAEYRRLQYGMAEGSAEVKRTNPETGNEVVDSENFDGIIDLSKVGRFTLVFDHNSSRHHTDVLHNESYIKSAERILTERLHRVGVLWLCDVMKEMDIRPKSKEEALLSRVICWTYDPSSKNKDCCVNLRAQRLFDGESKNYDNGYNPVYILDPNYDTNINQEWFKYMR